LNGEDWRIPPHIAVGFVEDGSVFIIAGVDRHEMERCYGLYDGDLRFFGAQLDGYPSDKRQIRSAGVPPHPDLLASTAGERVQDRGYRVEVVAGGLLGGGGVPGLDGRGQPRVRRS